MTTIIWLSYSFLWLNFLNLLEVGNLISFATVERSPALCLYQVSWRLIFMFAGMKVSSMWENISKVQGSRCFPVWKWEFYFNKDYFTGDDGTCIPPYSNTPSLEISTIYLDKILKATIKEWINPLLFIRPALKNNVLIMNPHLSGMFYHHNIVSFITATIAGSPANVGQGGDMGQGEAGPWDLQDSAVNIVWSVVTPCRMPAPSFVSFSSKQSVTTKFRKSLPSLPGVNHCVKSLKFCLKHSLG